MSFYTLKATFCRTYFVVCFLPATEIFLRIWMKEQCCQGIFFLFCMDQLFTQDII